jgi:hypothetical protein
MLYDVFICHASEDKDSFVRPLAEALRKSHLEVWYDEFALVIGDSLRESIDRGLSKSRYGVVVISPDFFKKRWPVRELNGLVAREMSGEHSVILPIWHNISVKQILEHSPPLADRKAVDTKEGLTVVCRELLKKLRPDESPLLVARDELIHFGQKPPVVTDEWWLDIVEASNRIPCWGFAIPENAHWGRWTFPLPNFQSRGEARGVRLAWTAMQLKWEKEAESQKITQITHPKIVLSFIDSLPGLNEMCHEHPDILAEYAPQLTIKNFGGEFENDFELLLKKSMSEQQQYIDQKSNFGSGLTTNNLPPACSENIALRHPTFGNYESGTIACQFVQGDLGGPEIKFYDTFEYIVWFLSDSASWVPQHIRDYLIDGLKKWNVWSNPTKDIRYELAETFLNSLWRAKSYKTFKFGKKTKGSLVDWVKHSLTVLNLDDSPEDIVERFISNGFIEGYYKKNDLP